MSHISVGIHGVGTFLPERRRTNSEWPTSFTQRFEEAQKFDITIPSIETGTWAADLAADVVRPYGRDPFRGAVERRVIADDDKSSDMEVRAAKAALASSETSPDEIDLLLVTSMVPDLIASSNAALVHRKLGLKPSALAINIDNTCISFIPQLLLATGQIQAGQVTKALLVQSAAFSRVMPYERPLSVNFGDGAAAAVVGKVSEGRGVLGSAWLNDGDFHRAACIAPANGDDWYKGSERFVISSLDIERGKAQVGRMGELCKVAVDSVLDKTKIAHREVNHFLVHQPTAWFGELCRRTSGLANAKMPYTFRDTAGVGPANILMNFDRGLSDKSIRADDVAVIYACGGGMSFASVALRWGK